MLLCQNVVTFLLIFNVFVEDVKSLPLVYRGFERRKQVGIRGVKKK